MAKKRAELSANAKEVYNTLVASETSLTLAELKELVPFANSSHLTALRNRDMVSAESTEKEVVTVTKRTVNVYSVTATDEVAEDAE